MPEPQETRDTTGPVKRKSQFSIGNLFLWTTTVSVGVVITNATLSDVKRSEASPKAMTDTVHLPQGHSLFHKAQIKYANLPLSVSARLLENWTLRVPAAKQTQ